MKQTGNILKKYYMDIQKFIIIWNVDFYIMQMIIYYLKQENNILDNRCDLAVVVVVLYLCSNSQEPNSK